MTPQLGGVQATVEVGDVLVTKRYRPEASDFGFRSEVDGLSTLAAVAGDQQRVHGWRLFVPDVVHVDESTRTIVMTRVPGVPFADERSLSRSDESSIVGVVADLLRVFWKRADVPYGDLHLGNVLVDVAERSVGMIDPGCAREAWHCPQLSMADWPRSRDRGYLAFIAAVSDNRPSAWRGRARRARLSWDLVRELGDGVEAHEREAAEVARFHVERMRGFAGRGFRRAAVARMAESRIKLSAPTAW